jgi:hypothetical protein
MGRCSDAKHIKHILTGKISFLLDYHLKWCSKEEESFCDIIRQNPKARVIEIQIGLPGLSVPVLLHFQKCFDGLGWLISIAEISFFKRITRFWNFSGNILKV